MSRNQNFLSKKSERKPYCKVCHDAGKPESEYTSHYVRSQPDRTGKTVVLCPVLKATECRYCFELGHTTKFCPVIAGKKKDEIRLQNAEKREEEKKVSQKPKIKPTFALLAEDSDNEEEAKPVDKKPIAAKPIAAKPVDEFPALAAVKSEAKPVLSGWANIAAKSAAEFQTEKKANSVKCQMFPPVKSKSPLMKKSWADWSDSDDEDECTYEKAKQSVMKASEMNWAVEDDEDW
jgi:hypothetical protein